MLVATTNWRQQNCHADAAWRYDVGRIIRWSTSRATCHGTLSSLVLKGFPGLKLLIWPLCSTSSPKARILHSKLMVVATKKCTTWDHKKLIQWRQQLPLTCRVTFSFEYTKIAKGAALEQYHGKIIQLCWSKYVMGGWNIVLWPSLEGCRKDLVWAFSPRQCVLNLNDMGIENMNTDNTAMLCIGSIPTMW